MALDVYTPIGGTVALAVGTATARAALPDPRIGTEDRSLRILNAGDDTAFVAFGGSTVAAAVPVDGAPANGIPIPPSHAPEPFRIPPDATHLAAICRSGSATLYITLGRGL
jgi:hypothetical protein